MSKGNLNFIPLTEKRLYDLLEQANTMGAMCVLNKLGLINDLRTKADMYRAHGRKTVDRLIRTGMLTPHIQRGCKYPRYSEQQFYNLIQ